MFLDKIQFRKLANGYTVKYHVAVAAEMAGTGPSGFGNEIYCTDRDNLAACIASLIEKYLDVPDRNPKVAEAKE